MSDSELESILGARADALTQSQIFGISTCVYNFPFPRYDTHPSREGTPAVHLGLMTVVPRPTPDVLPAPPTEFRYCTTLARGFTFDDPTRREEFDRLLAVIVSTAHLDLPVLVYTYPGEPYTDVLSRVRLDPDQVSQFADALAANYV